MDLKYGPDGEAIEHAIITGDAVLQLAGQKGSAGRQITANVLDITLAPDGATPVGLVGREAVQLTFPAEQGSGGRTIKAMNLDARGDPKKGLTSALFTGADGPACQDRRTAPPECDVDYREQDARGPSAGQGQLADGGAEAGHELDRGGDLLPERPLPGGHPGRPGGAREVRARHRQPRIDRHRAGDAASASRKRADHHRRDAHRRHAGRAEDEGDRRGQQRAEAGEVQRPESRHQDAVDAEERSGGLHRRRRIWTTTAGSRRRPTPAARNCGRPRRPFRPRPSRSTTRAATSPPRDR